MFKKISTLLLLALVVATTSQTSVHAQTIQPPDFPSCENPSGTVIAQYNEGIHGVPGDSTTYTGADTVYKINDAQVVQCLCPDSGGGVQTLWWKIPQLSNADANILGSQGWIYIPNGALWGLDSAPYLARNSAFSCDGRGGGSVLGDSTQSSQPGQILGASTFAATGSGTATGALMGLGLVFIAVALELRRNYR